MNKKNLRASLILLSIVLIYWVQGYFAPKDPEVQIKPKELQTVYVKNSVAQNFRLPIILKSETQDFSKADIKSQRSEKIISVNFNHGDYVNAGEVICQLDSGEKMANFKRLEIEYTSAKELNKKGLTSESALITAETTYEQARIALDRTKLSAPFDGFVDNLAKEGELLQNGQICGTLVSLSPLKVIGNVSEIAVSNIAMGLPVEIKLISGDTFNSKVTFVGSIADPQTRTFRVESELKNLDSSIKDGLTGEMTIFTEGELAHFIPTSAFLLADNGDVSLATVEDNKVEIYVVQILLDTVDGAWVTGLPEEASIIIAGQGFVKKGDMVKTKSM